ncbi:DegT/DnrJ/EryC1/StrS family aminotransferase [Methanolobus chelungpuianus]|uniref:Aminotransferase DegT n=1 Tax=Methanolobus chelungpuianus TaxID=502115 RepID=A0AAE3KXY0_9EURY|nr:DegT/DnrJ/EryC1/StrS family aminotransferase [Methanolobus chelungpuianus]MCQ6963440.1 aminotransferase DegT [Methanolobus chelungpuianus]
MINVTRPYLPEREKLDEYIDSIYETSILTNNGPLVQELTKRLQEYLGVENLLLVSNGTVALQIAYRVFSLSGQAITTPFSFVATTSSLVWERIEPVFVDIDPETLCMDPSKIEDAITSRTTAIVPVHVFGNSCEVEQISKIASERDLKVIYDGAHAFGVQYKGKSLLAYGDATTLSFHATKLFHTIEGGAIIFKDRDAYNKARLMINFGIDNSNSVVGVGINAKMNEFQAAMGLCVLDEIGTIMTERKNIWHQYQKSLEGLLKFIKYNPSASNNYSYVPVLLESEEVLLEIKDEMNKQGINPRRYFFPSLDTLPYMNSQSLKYISGDISKRIMCLPIYPGMSSGEVQSVIKVIESCLSAKYATIK